MSLLQGWKAWRKFRNLSWDWRNLVFFSESGQDWHQFSGLIDALNQDFGRRVCYVTADPGDAGLGRRHENYIAICIPAGLFLTAFFQVSQCDTLVLTMMDLGNLQLKRSLYPVHYIYLFHSMGSTHMVDHADSFDHYDSLFCSGPHQVAEIRKRESLKKLPARHLFDFGHPRLEQVMHEATAYRDWQSSEPGVDLARPPVILVAPTWGDTSIFNVCGGELIAVLLAAGFHVIMRPHYQSNKLTPHLIEAVRDRFTDHPGFEYIDQMAETDSILRSNLLISDWSAMAMEYALGLEKPVLFIDVPRRIRNPDWQELGLEPIESSIRDQVGIIVSPDRLFEVPARVHELMASGKEWVGRMRELREQLVFRLGHSVADGAAEIARLADRQRALRLELDQDRAHG